MLTAYALLKAEGWPDSVVAASAIPYNKDTFVPKEMSKEDIEKFKRDWAAAVKRALQVGFDVGNSFKTSKYTANS